MEEDEESYLAILSDSADHCVTRKVCADVFCRQCKMRLSRLPPRQVPMIR